MDTRLTPVMDDLRACVCAALEDTRGGSMECFCSLIPGVRAIPDGCSCKGTNKCGMAWVRLVRLFPSTDSFPSPDRAAKCAAVLAATLEVGTYRCQPTGSATAGPSAVEQTEATLVQNDDALALYQAIGCCEAITRRPYTMGTWEPRSGAGCGGGAWTVTVSLIRL